MIAGGLLTGVGPVRPATKTYVQGHPPEKDVTLRLVSLEDGKVTVLAELLGGQGTINVPSWSPDSKSLAFVSYQRVP